MTSLPAATIPGHTTQTAGCNEPGHLVGQRTRRLHQSAADALIDDLLAAVFPAAGPAAFPFADSMKKASQCALGSADGQLLSCMEWAVHVWHEAGDQPDRQLCWLWRSLLVAGRAREAAAHAWMWRQWRPDVTLFPVRRPGLTASSGSS